MTKMPIFNFSNQFSISSNYQGGKSKCNAADKYQFFRIFSNFASRRCDRTKLQSRDQQLRMDGQNLEDPKSTADMTVFVQNLLQQMQSRFQAMSDSIVTKNILFHSQFDGNEYYRHQ
ncbi:unnamed protein product, partial [Vitis vinifera]